VITTDSSSTDQLFPRGTPAATEQEQTREPSYQETAINQRRFRLGQWWQEKEGKATRET